MSKQSDLELNKKFKAICGNCKQITNHKVLKRTMKGWHSEDLDGCDYYEIVECMGCEQFSFRAWSINSDDRNPETGEFYETTTLYPKRTIDTKTSKNYWPAGKEVRAIYKESIEAFNNNLPILCFAGLRATIEGICLEKGIKGGKIIKESNGKRFEKIENNLEGKINGLSEDSYITKTQSEILHQLRFLGNDAVHSLEVPSMDSLLIAIDIIEHILDALYEVEEKAEQIKRDRKQAKQKKGKNSY